MEHHLKPQLGHLRVNKLTTSDIDAVYLHLLRGGGRDGAPLAPGTVHRIHVVLRVRRNGWRLDAALDRVDTRIAELKALRREIVSARTACEKGRCGFIAADGV